MFDCATTKNDPNLSTFSESLRVSIRQDVSPMHESPAIASPYLVLYGSHPLGSQQPRSARETALPHSLQLRWEVKGISGKAYQKDGNLSLYRRKVMPTMLFESFLERTQGSIEDAPFRAFDERQETGEHWGY